MSLGMDLHIRMYAVLGYKGLGLFLGALSAVEMLHDSALYKCTIDMDIDFA